MYNLTFTHEENWRCAQESLVFGIALREGNLQTLALFPYLKGICSVGHFQQLWQMLLEIENTHKESLEKCQMKFSNEIIQLDELRQRIKELRIEKQFLERTGSYRCNIIQFPMSIEINRDELLALEQETNRLARTYMAQLDVVLDIWGIWGSMEIEDFSILRESIKNCKTLIDGLPINTTIGISSIDYHEDGRILFDLHQVLRHRRSYDDRPDITPKNRWTMGGVGVNYDEPTGWSLQSETGGIPLVQIQQKQTDLE